MTPQQTLDEFTDSVNARAKLVLTPVKESEFFVTGFGMPRKSAEDSCKIYQHRHETSEEYATPLDAVNDLIKKIKALLPKEIDEIFWRVKPYIGQTLQQ